ncbi:activating signal cointegrator 1 complex subunit 2 [Dorcoceras hygrometricum]|uniref:Activating signal cointegrator 1 complex subunit 2 n=1 Tax=Dorcoceras hygrometricum TaxID=472368 RepID=A0A2Z7D7K4_9LAMI|nr:activating signal cointegrator 1 complex subunit 2 [Dorcoceras hygrometricum]
MSSRHISETRNDYKSSHKPQKKFVPKTDFQKLNTRQTTLSSSIRADGVDGMDAEIASTGRVTTGENGEWASKSSATGGFVIYLPQDESVAAGLRADEGGLDPVDSQHVVDLLNRELSRLLKLGPKHFWREVSTDESLYAFLESFLKFRSRWYDFPHHGVRGTVAGVIVDESELCRRVFMVLYRLSSNQDPGAKAADTLSPKDHAVVRIVLLQSKKLLDLPKLLDICAIYGQDNEDLTRRLVMNAMKAQPLLQDDFPVLMSNFVSIVRTMYQRCDSTSKDLLGSGGFKDQGSNQFCSDALEFIDFVNDTVVSLDSFVNAYKHSAVFFASPVERSDGNEELLMTLARLHDSLLPSLQKVFHMIFGSVESRNQETSRDMFSNVFISLKMLYTRIMFPANVEDPVVRADILIQSLKDLSGFPSYDSEGRSRETFIQSIEKDHKILSRIQLLQQTGWISMDNEQFQYLAGIMKYPLETDIKLKFPTPVLTTSKAMHTDENAAIVESKISQIKELFPDYGRGFLVACLEAFNQDAEEVIQRILEGTLHEELQTLDTKLESIPSRVAAPSVSRYDKGKGKLVEFVESPSEVAASTAVKTTGVSSTSSSTSVGRFIRKNADDLSKFEMLDAKDKELAKTAVLNSQLEYEDEYDDSFDDLGLSVGDSRLEESEELEDKMNSRRGGSSEVNGGGSTSNSDDSKWGSRRKPLFYVKDGKNYSYKVDGSVAAANYNEAKLLNQAQKELIHGLGRGGNIPLGSVKKLEELNELQINGHATDEVEEYGRGGQGIARGRGKRGFSYRAIKKVSGSNEERTTGQDTEEVGGRSGRGGGRRGGGSNEERAMGQDTEEVGGRGGRGGGRRGGGRNHNRQDRAMKKHFSGMPGHYNA